MRGKGLDISPQNLKLADNAALILPSHGRLDRARDARRGEKAIGTTGRGIGPAYEDKVGRRAVRVCDLAEPAALADRVDDLLVHHNALLRGLDEPEVDRAELLDALRAVAPKILPYADQCWRLLGERGREFGTVTGRPRRCGWFDAVAVRQAIRIGGIDGIALTKLDVLDGFDEIKVCTAYKRGRKKYDYLPAGTAAQAELEPVYETAEGWRESTRGARSWADLPATAIKYIRRLEELIGAPVAMLSTSPEREDTVLVRDPFAD